MILVHTCARAARRHAPPKKVDKNGAIWCILSVPKYVIINLKTMIFRIINQHLKCCAIFFYKINPDAHASTKIKNIPILQGGGGVRVQ